MANTSTRGLILYLYRGSGTASDHFKTSGSLVLSPGTGESY